MHLLAFLVVLAHHIMAISGFFKLFSDGILWQFSGKSLRCQDLILTICRILFAFCGPMFNHPRLGFQLANLFPRRGIRLTAYKARTCSFTWTCIIYRRTCLSSCAPRQIFASRLLNVKADTIIALNRYLQTILHTQCWYWLSLVVLEQVWLIYKPKIGPFIINIPKQFLYRCF